MLSARIVVLFESKSELAGTDRAAAVHVAAERFCLDDQFVETVEDRLHVHDSQVSLKT